MNIRLIRRRLLPLLVIIMCSASLAGCFGTCSKVDSKTYTVSGRVLDTQGLGVQGVTLAFTGGSTGTATTDDAGRWQATLKGKTTVTPGKSGYSFEPQSRVVSSAANNVDFLATKELVLHDNARVMPDEEGSNIGSISDDRSTVVFASSTDYVKSLSVGDVIAGDPVPGAPYGFLQRILSISEDGRTITTEDAALEDLIQEGEIFVSESVSLEELMQNVVLPEDAGIRAIDPETLEINREIAPGVFVNGYLRFHGDIVFDVDLSILSGIRNVEFVVKTGIESDLSLSSTASDEIPRTEVLLGSIAGPIITPYVGVNIHTFLSFVAGAEGKMEAGLETGFNLNRGYEVGLEWTKGKGFSPVNRKTGDLWTVREPTLSGKASALVYAGARVEGLLYGALGPYAKLYAYGEFEAESELSASETKWEYDLGIGLESTAGATLALQWLTWSINENWECDPMRLYHVPIAYGVSGRVVDNGGAGIGSVKLQFSNGADPAFTSSDGHWSKHFLLSDGTTVTPSKAGHTFVPATRQVTSGTSGVNFTGTAADHSYSVSGRVVDSNGAGLGGVTLAFSEGYGSVTTSADGTWSKAGLKGTVTVTPSKEGWTFDPPNRQVSRATYTVDFAAQLNSFPITFEDPNLEAVVREAIGKPTGQLMNTDVMHITKLEAHDRNISRLGGIEHLINLWWLEVGYNNISDLGPLSRLTNLMYLFAWYNQFSDLTPLSGLHELRMLYFHKCPVSDLTPIAGLTKLGTLAGHDSLITDISPIAGLTNLGFLWLSGNPISDISVIAGLTQLKHLSLDRVPIRDFSVVSGLTNMRFLSLDGNELTDISFIANLTNMKTLYLSANQITDISVLAEMTDLWDLLLDGNQISDITPLSGLTELTRIHLGYNRISNIDALSALMNVNQLYLYGNEIAYIDCLEGLTELETLDLAQNLIADIAPLVANPGLGNGDQISLEYNLLDLSPGSDDMRNINILIERGADVSYSPQGPAPSAGVFSLDRYYDDPKYDPVDGTLILR